MNLLQTAFADHQRVIAELQAQAPLIERLAETLISCLRGGGKVCWCGNGGSAADAQHLAAELVGRFRRERRGLPSIALTTDSSILTAVANDYGYDRIFSRQVEALCRPGDVLVGITTSGNSANILAAVAEARRLGVRTIGLTGRDGGQLKQAADLCLVVNHPETARIQEAHILVGHILCDLTEAALL